MQRLVVLALILYGASTVWPDVRAKAMPHARTVAEHMRADGGQVPGLDRILRWSTAEELRGIARGLQELEATGRPLPPPELFPQYIARRDPSGRQGRDPWGTRYYLRVARDSITVGSAGPDRIPDTRNDVRIRVPRH